MPAYPMKRLGCIVVFWLLGIAVQAAPAGRQEIDLSGGGWRLWHDDDAAWQRDELFLPPVDLAKLPVNPPTGGWEALATAPALAVSVPGTVEEYLQKTPGPDGDITGVSWWWRSLRIPPADGPRKILLRFESVRLRAEVYVNQKLVGYDLITGTPFEVDLTPFVKPGETCQLAVRITDPGGNFNWRDSSTFNWGRYRLPLSHGFGGITGPVRLIECDPVYVEDTALQNTPAITEANAQITIHNSSDAEAKRDVVVRVFERANPAAEVFLTELKDVPLPPGETTVPVKISAPQAKIWDLDQPNLYVCEVALNNAGERADLTHDTFGFRWFAPEGIGTDAMFRLNGRRIVLRTAISWGFWPINGIFPTPEMAEKQVRDAKAFGLNMLNFHRAIGSPIVLDKADELGLLYYEEPGAYRVGDNDPFTHAILREKLLRMVRRDRNHPSLVIFSMINEGGEVRGAALALHRKDMADAHALDPTRTITRTSAWASGAGMDVEDTSKMHMRPYDDTIYLSGWYDFHHAGGPAVWQQSFYRGPAAFYNYTTDRPEIVFWGEEGAISTPPRLELIKKELEASPVLGWDGATYLEWYKVFDDFLTQKNLRGAFPTVDKFTTAMGAISLEHQGRKIQIIRLSNLTDGYAVNGWEEELIEDHSGIVDEFRNPKADPAILAYYNQPLYVAVMPRTTIVQIPGNATVDFHLINEKNLHGTFTLHVDGQNSAGQNIFAKDLPVTIAGGDVYGQLLAENVTIPIANTTGNFTIEARLLDAAGREQASGHDAIFAVDWKSQLLAGRGATWESGEQVRDFLKNEKQLDVPAYTDQLGPLDWVLVASSPSQDSLVTVPPGVFRDPTGRQPGVMVTFYNDQNFRLPATQHPEPAIDLLTAEGATPDPAMSVLNNYSIVWEGQLVPPTTGTYHFDVDSNGTTTMVAINGQPLGRGGRGGGGGANFNLVAGQPVTVTVRFTKDRGAASCRLLWAPPSTNVQAAQGLFDRAKQDGTTIVLLNHAETWMDLVAQNTGVTYRGSFAVGTTWLGGDHFVKQHPLFQDLPVNDAMNWVYQAVVRNGNARLGFLLSGEELVAGVYHSHNPGVSPMALGTAVGVIPCGKGRVIFSTLDICDNLDGPPGPADVARKLLCNFVAYAAKK